MRSTVAVAPLPSRRWLNLPSGFSGVPEVMVWVMSSSFVKLTRLPAGTSMDVGLNWKVWMVTPCAVPAGALSITSRPSATAAPAAADCQLCFPSITASPVALSPLTEIYGAGAWTDWDADLAFLGEEGKGAVTYARTTLLGLPLTLFREAGGIEGVEGELRAPRQDEIGDGAPHGRPIHDAFACRARAHVHVLEPRDAPEQEQPVRCERAQARGLVDDLSIGHRWKHRDQGRPDLITGLGRGLLVEACFLLGGACPQEAVGLRGGVVVSPAHGAGHGRPRRLQTKDLALERAHLDGHVDPARRLTTPRTKTQHDGGAGNLSALEDHGGDAPARATEPGDLSVPHGHAHLLGGTREGQHEPIGLDVRRTVDQDRADRLLRDARLHAARLVSVHPARGVPGLLLLPGQGGLESTHICFGEGEGERGAHAEVDVHLRLLDKDLGQLAMESHPLLRHFGEGSGDAEAAQRAQPTIRVAGGVTTDGVALDDDARH